VIIKFLSFLVALIYLASGNVVAQNSGIGSAIAQTTDAGTSKGDAWYSYRDWYRSMIRFEKYGGPKQFIQNHLQVTLTDKKATMEGARLTLDGRSIHLNLPLDPIGRAVFPMLKVAYDENAELRVNRPAGMVALEHRISIQTRPDGVYEVADLRAACDQVLLYLRYSGGLSYSLKQCVGVKFSYPKDANSVVLKFKSLEHAQMLLPVTEGAAFWGDTINAFKVVSLHFSDWPDKGQIIANDVPLAIAAIFD
jgi:hypothetical protein